MAKRLLKNVQTGYGVHTAFLFSMGTGGSFRGGEVVKCPEREDEHLLVPNLRMSGAVPPAYPTCFHGADSSTL